METQKKVLVCRAQVVWKNPDYFPENEVYLYVSDGCDTFLTKDPLEDLADLLIKGIALQEPLFVGDKSPIINYVPPLKAQLTYIDGYFGRPPLAAELLRLSALEPNEIEDFERYLTKKR